MDQGKAKEEIAGRDPAGVDYIGAKEGDDDGSAAKDDSAGEVKVIEELERQRRRGES